MPTWFTGNGEICPLRELSASALVSIPPRDDG